MNVARDFSWQHSELPQAWGNTGIKLPFWSEMMKTEAS